MPGGREFFLLCLGGERVDCVGKKKREKQRRRHRLLNLFFPLSLSSPCSPRNLLFPRSDDVRNILALFECFVYRSWAWIVRNERT